MNIIICDDRIDDRKNVSDLLSDYGEKKNYEFTITEYDSGEQLCEDQSALEAPLVAQVPEVLVLGVVGLAVDLQGHVVRLGVGDLLLTRLDIPLPPPLSGSCRYRAARRGYPPNRRRR